MADKKKIRIVKLVIVFTIIGIIGVLYKPNMNDMFAIGSFQIRRYAVVQSLTIILLVLTLPVPFIRITGASRSSTIKIRLFAYLAAASIGMFILLRGPDINSMNDQLVFGMFHILRYTAVQS